MRYSHLFDIFGYHVLFKVQFYKKLDIRTCGEESRVPGTALHTIFLDFDNIVACNSDYDPEERLKEELQDIQHEFEIGNFHVFETRNVGRHAVCIDALRFRDVKDVVDYSSCDLKFKNAPSINEYRCWVLRFENKGNRPPPKYLYTVESPHEGKNPQSLPHAKFLLQFGLKIDLKNPVGSGGIRIQEYNTTDRHKKEPLPAEDKRE